MTSLLIRLCLGPLQIISPSLASKKSIEWIKRAAGPWPREDFFIVGSFQILGNLATNPPKNCGVWTPRTSNFWMYDGRSSPNSTFFLLKYLPNWRKLSRILRNKVSIHNWKRVISLHLFIKSKTRCYKINLFPKTIIWKYFRLWFSTKKQKSEEKDEKFLQGRAILLVGECVLRT